MSLNTHINDKATLIWATADMLTHVYHKGIMGSTENQESKYA